MSNGRRKRNSERIFLDNLEFKDEREFLLCGERRGINDVPWLASQLPELKIVGVSTKQGSLDELVETVKRSKHQITVLTPEQLPDFLNVNSTDVFVIDSNKKNPAIPLIQEYRLPILSTEGRKGNNIPLYSSGMHSLTKALCKAEQTAPVFIVSNDKKQAERFALLSDSTDTYFSLTPLNFKELESVVKAYDLTKSAIVFLGDPAKEETAGMEPGLSRVLELSKRAPIIYVKPTKFWRQHELDALLSDGLFDYIGIDMTKYLLADLPDVEDTSEEKKPTEDTKLLSAIERVNNSLHAAFLTRQVYSVSEKREAFGLARKKMPYVLFVGRRNNSLRYMQELQSNMGVNTMNIHVRGEFKGNSYFENLAVREARRLNKGWRPNIIYIEMTEDTSDAKLRVKNYLRFQHFLRRNKSTIFVIGYNSNKTQIEDAETLKDGHENVLLLRDPTNPALVRKINDSWDLFKKRFEEKKPRFTEEINLKKRIFYEYKELLSVEPRELEEMLSSTFDFKGQQPEPICIGRPVFPGAASGRLYAHTSTYNQIEEAIKAKREGESVILYVEDLTKLKLSELKEIKGFSGMILKNVSEVNHYTIDLLLSGMPVVCAEQLIVEESHSLFNQDKTDSNRIITRTEVSIDGTTGKIYSGKYNILPPIVFSTHPVTEERIKFDHIMSKSNELLPKNLEIMINADTSQQILEARKYGVESVALVRSENVVKANNQNVLIYGDLLMTIFALKKLEQDKGSMSEEEYASQSRINSELKERAISNFEQMQAKAFYEILKLQENRRTQVRLLDPPMREIFSNADADAIEKRLKNSYQKGKKEFLDRIEDSSIRGAKLLVWPEIYETQIKALFEAYKKVLEEGGKKPDLRIFIPYVEGESQVRIVKEMADNLNKKHFGDSIQYKLGVTLETVAGCQRAPTMIKELGICNFAIGTNDLIPNIEGSVRGHQQLDSAPFVQKTSDGKTILLEKGITDYIQQTIDSIYEAAKQANSQISLGLCGEMNESKLHSENLGQFIPQVTYLSAGRPLQIPLLTLLSARNNEQYK